MAMPSEETTLHLNLSGESTQVQVYVFYERRSTLRAAIGKKGLIFRMPLGLRESHKQEAWQWFRDWVTQLSHQRPEVFRAIRPKTFKNGDSILVGSRNYRLHLEYKPRATHAGRLLSGGNIHCTLADHLQPEAYGAAIKTLLSRIIGNDFFSEIHTRVHQLNQIHFNYTIRSIQLKYLTSKWGSCSGRGTINLSTRLLFAPEDVQNYVIIHELAHLQEMNHSDKFWRLVQKAMPDYQTKEHWLKQYGHLCDF